MVKQIWGNLVSSTGLGKDWNARLAKAHKQLLWVVDARNEGLEAFHREEIFFSS